MNIANKRGVSRFRVSKSLVRSREMATVCVVLLLTLLPGETPTAASSTARVLLGKVLYLPNPQEH